MSLTDTERAAAEAFTRQHPGGAKSLLQQLGVAVADQPALIGAQVDVTIERAPSQPPRIIAIRKPRAVKPAAPIHPKLAGLMAPTGRPVRKPKTTRQVGHGPDSITGQELEVVVDTVEPEPAPKTTKPKYPTREAWMLAAVKAFTPRFKAAGVELPPVRISIGWPGGRGNKQHVVGQCWHPATVSDGIPAVFVSPRQKTPVEVLDTILHELVHAAGAFGHEGQFAKIGKAVGLQKPWKSTPPSEELKVELEALSEKLGPFGHASIHGDSVGGGGPVLAGEDGPPVQSTRMLKVVCQEQHDNGDLDGYLVRTTRKWLEAGLPQCPEGHTMNPAVDRALWEVPA